MKIFLVLSLGLISVFLNAQSINLKSGWQLKGTEVGFNNMNSFKKDCIETVWRYNDIEKKWEAFSPKEAIQEKIKNSMFVSKLDKINPNDGFWIFADNNCTIESNSTTHDMNLSRGLVAWYQFEGNANDSSGNGNDGVEHGGVTYVDGVIGKAAKFDGVDDYIAITPNINNSFTFAIWFKTKESNTGTMPYEGKHIISNENSSSNSVFESGSDVYLTILNNSISFGGSDTKALADRALFGNSKVIDNQWHFVVVSHQNQNTLLYLDNKLEISSNIYSFNIGTQQLNIGYSLNDIGLTPNRFFSGLIDDLRIYNRALSESEIKELYDLGIKSMCTQQIIYAKSPITKTKIDNLNTGWHLLGTSTPINNLDIFDNTKIIWKYDNNNWKAYSPNNTLQSLINSNPDIDTLQNIQAYEGFWINK